MVQSASHSLDRLEVMFDDDRAVADTGLILPATLAQRLGLDYVLVRPMTLTNGPATGTYRAAVRLPIKLTDNISRADVAGFMLDQLNGTPWLGQAVSLAY